MSLSLEPLDLLLNDESTAKRRVESRTAGYDDKLRSEDESWATSEAKIPKGMTILERML